MREDLHVGNYLSHRVRSVIMEHTLSVEDATEERCLHIMY